MNEPKWLTPLDVMALHSEQLAIFGGPGGIRDIGLLDSAVMRPRSRWASEPTDLAGLAASYAFGIAKNHAFVDGNKRAAFAALVVFLRLNDLQFAPDPAIATAAILSLAASELDEAGLAAWIRSPLAAAEAR